MNKSEKFGKELKSKKPVRVCFTALVNKHT